MHWQATLRIRYKDQDPEDQRSPEEKEFAEELYEVKTWTETNKLIARNINTLYKTVQWTKGKEPITMGPREWRSDDDNRKLAKIQEDNNRGITREGNNFRASTAEGLMAALMPMAGNS